MSDRFARTARTSLISLVLLGAAAGLSACQVRPLYGGSQGKALSENMAAIAYNTPTTRVAQQVENQLIFLSGRGKGESANPLYRVDVSAYAATSDVLVEDNSDTADAGRTIVVANYAMRRVSDNKLLTSGTRRSIALLDFPSQEYAKLRAIRDAENRAAKDVAELINADLAIALTKEAAAQPAAGVLPPPASAAAPAN
ncbi:hypothetical protein [Martelella sp. HB161492]|uniref:hypothetical protein n=1 Tax=Martelella sp. HB161492 TaxID=2720726 RepID=UPI00158FA7E9|nr:hypothetical protein [Martelella sp. HB161492]